MLSNWKRFALKVFQFNKKPLMCTAIHTVFKIVLYYGFAFLLITTWKEKQIEHKFHMIMWKIRMPNDHQNNAKFRCHVWYVKTICFLMYKYISWYKTYNMSNTPFTFGNYILYKVPNWILVSYSNDQCIFLMILKFLPTSSKQRGAIGTHLPTLSFFQIISHDMFQYAIL